MFEGRGATLVLPYVSAFASGHCSRLQIKPCCRCDAFVLADGNFGLTLQKDIIPVCRELGIGIVAYSPIGRGFLAGKYKSAEDLADDDWRRTQPRFAQAAFEKVRHLQQMRSRASSYPQECTVPVLAKQQKWSTRWRKEPVPVSVFMAFLGSSCMTIQQQRD